MKVDGAILVLDTIKMLLSGNYNSIDQQNLSSDPLLLKKAPKIFKDHCRIDWNNDVVKIQNQIRGLSYTPGAVTELISPNETTFSLKIFRSEFHLTDKKVMQGSIETDNHKYFRIFASNGFLDLKEVQLSGKKLMKVDDLLRGFKINNQFIAR